MMKALDIIDSLCLEINNSLMLLLYVKCAFCYLLYCKPQGTQFLLIDYNIKSCLKKVLYLVIIVKNIGYFSPSYKHVNKFQFTTKGDITKF